MHPGGMPDERSGIGAAGGTHAGVRPMLRSIQPAVSAYRPQPPAIVFNPFGIGTTAADDYGAKSSLPGD
jgi:hypothetical protein